MKTFKSQIEVNAALKDGNLLEADSICFESDIIINGNIHVVDITGRDITARDITARDITGRDITARDITGRDITARDIAAESISYNLVLSASSLRCKSVSCRYPSPRQDIFRNSYQGLIRRVGTNAMLPIYYITAPEWHWKIYNVRKVTDVTYKGGFVIGEELVNTIKEQTVTFYQHKASMCDAFGHNTSFYIGMRCNGSRVRSEISVINHGGKGGNYGSRDTFDSLWDDIPTPDGGLRLKDVFNHPNIPEEFKNLAEILLVKIGGKQIGAHKKLQLLDTLGED